MYIQKHTKTKRNVKVIYLPSDLLTEVISLVSTGINFGDKGPGAVLILVKQIVLQIAETKKRKQKWSLESNLKGDNT